MTMKKGTWNEKAIGNPAMKSRDDSFSAVKLAENEAFDIASAMTNLEKDIDGNIVVNTLGTTIYSKENADKQHKGVYHVKGSVATYSDLPASHAVGDVYNVLDTGANYVWTDDGWDKLSETVDLSGYMTKEDAKESFEQLEAELETKASASEVQTIKNDLGDLGDQVSVIESKIPEDASPENPLVTKADINSVGTTDKYGIEADYALHYGITDCPNGLIQIVSGKEIELQPGIVLQMAGAPYKTQIGSKLRYTIQKTGKCVLFLVRTESEGGTIQMGFIEAMVMDVYYQETEPENGVSAPLAWWQPSKGLWQFKSNDTGNVWRTAQAAPIANINAADDLITTIDYIGYRIINDDIFVDQTEIESINETISTINSNISTLDGQTTAALQLATKNARDKLDITVAENTYATKSEVDTASTSGKIIGSYWFGKTKADTIVPAPTIVGQNYYDFTTGQVYKSNDGKTWTLIGTNTPPTDIDAQIVITSKFWDITEQENQHGGKAWWSHTNSDWSYSPSIYEDKPAGGASLPLLTRLISNHKFNDVSYLNANTFSWHDGSMYKAVYQHLVDGYKLVQGDWVSTNQTPIKTLYSIGYGNGQYLVGGSSAIYRLEKDNTLTQLTSAQNCRGLVYGNNTWVGVGSNSTYISTDDGATWISKLVVIKTSFYGVAYGNGKFVIVGDSGKIYISDDGNTWTAATKVVSVTIRDIVYSGDKFVAVGNTGVILTSSNGVDWTQQTSPIDSNLYGVAWGNGQFIAIGEMGAVLVSLDGETWVSNSRITSWDLASITYGCGKFAVATSMGMVYKSANGNDWANEATDALILSAITYGNGEFVAVGTHVASVGSTSYDYIVRQEYGIVKRNTFAGIDIECATSDNGLKICAPDQEDAVIQLYDKTGEANFFILDTENARFKLPRTQKRKLIYSVKNDGKSWYNLYSDGWVEQGGLDSTGSGVKTITLLVEMANTNYNALCSTISESAASGIGVSVTSTTQFKINKPNTGCFWRVSGYAADSVLANEPIQYEYYYVGNFSQSAIEQTAGLNAEMFNEKADITVVPGLIVPDYTKKKDITSPYTCESDCLIVFTIQGGQNINLTVNGVSVLTNAVYSQDVAMVTLPFKSGTLLNWTGLAAMFPIGGMAA